MIKYGKYYDGWGNVSEGTEISEETYDRLLNVMPPISLSKSPYCGFQICEPYDYDFDNGNLRALYLTFVNINDKYYYAGINFGGECKWRLTI